MDVLELKAVQEKNNGTKPRKYELQVRETQRLERAISTEQRSRQEGERTSHTALLHLIVYVLHCARKTELPFILCTTKVNPTEEKNTVACSKQTEKTCKS